VHNRIVSGLISLCSSGLQFIVGS